MRALPSRSFAISDPRPLISASQVADYSERLDQLALMVMHLPEQDLTVAQAARLRILAKELARRGR